MQVSLIREQSKKRGAKRTIKLAAIAAKGMIQYTKDHEKLRNVIREYGAFNVITILNHGSIDIEIALDFVEGKTYPVPNKSSLSLDEVTYQEFNVVNLDAANPTVDNEITVVAIYEPPEVRERMRTHKHIGGR